MHEPSSESAPDAWRAFRADLERVAPSRATVLLEGEPGTGKSRAAADLHRRAPWASGPLVVVDLGALPATLIEAELFGHEEGAFTGASHARRGRFQRADGGTLVLEGVEGLPAEQQGKLLRVLQERAVEPLGAERPVPIEVRVVATSAADLAEEVGAGRFREDLFYRLAVVRLSVPPLRARGAGILDLAEELAVGVARRLGLPPRTLGEAARRRLAEHPWPGNVRELENALERVTVLAPRDASGAAPPVEVEELAFLDEARSGAAERLAVEALAHGVGLEELDRALLETALREERDNLSAAARRLGLTRRAFEYRWNKLGGATPTEPSP